jgi:hypothetical protein
MMPDRKHILPALVKIAMLLTAGRLPAQFLYWDYIDMVTDTVESGAYADMVVGPDGKIHISYWQRTEDKLIYAWKAPGEPGWHLEYVDPTHQNGFRSSVCLDATGAVHIAYYEDVSSQVAIRYAKRLGPGNWSVEQVPDIYGRGYGNYGPWGTATTKERVQHSLELVFDENNQPHIAFFDGWMMIDAFPTCTPNSNYGFKLHQAIRINGQWTARSLGHVSDLFRSCNPFASRDSLPLGDRYGEYLDLLVEPDGTMDIFSMSRFNNHITRHRTIFPYVDTLWVRSVVDSLPRLLPNFTNSWSNFNRFYTLEGISATMTPDRNIHLAYTSSIFYGENFCCTSSTNDLVYTRISPAGVPTYHMFGTGSYRNYTDIATRGGSDSVFILYADLSRSAFILAESFDSGNTWSHDTILPGIAIGKCQLEIHGDSIYALIFDSQRENLLLWKRYLIGGEWSVDQVTLSQNRGQSIEAALTFANEDTIVDVAFTDSYTGRLYHARGTKATGWNWVIGQLDHQSPNTTAPALSMTSADEPVVVYNGGSARDLRMARHTAGGWQYEVVAQGANPQFTDIEVSANDTLHVIYYDGNQGCMHWAHRHLDDSTWVTEGVTCETMNSGLFPSLQLDENGLPHVAFYNGNDRSLYYASLNGTTRRWEIDSVDGGTHSAIGKYSSLVFDSAGLPKIAYLNEQEDDVLLAEMDASGAWVRTVVDSLPIANIGRPIDLQLDPFGKVWIAYNYFGDFDRTKLMHRDGPVWREVGVSSAGRIANAFDFKVSGGDLFLIGKKNEIQNTGVAMLYAKNGVFVEALEAEQLSQNVRFQNYPDPFSGVTTFRMELKRPENLSLYIIDLLGRPVGSVFDSWSMGAGIHESRFDGSHLDPGIYFCELRSDTDRMVKKVVVSR